VVLDTHRRDRMGCYGYGRDVSPNIDAFAARATVFDNAISPAQWTIPTHASFFTGEAPSTHMILQAFDALDPRLPTLAERLAAGGYRTTAFCNNPLVGILDNGFRRGFEAFYNYGGAAPSGYGQPHGWLPGPLASAWDRWTDLFRAFAYRVQNLFTRPNRLFRVAMHPFMVPLWTRFARFKGDTSASVRDILHFCETGLGHDPDRPDFVFVNLMQTHLPFAPPRPFIKRFAPIVLEDRKASRFMRWYNTRPLDWVFPLEEPFPALHARTLSDMYDAEVAYQDHLLARFFALLDEPGRRDDTLVILVSDHGEMLGEHLYMGHGLGAFQELAHVPMIIRFPGQGAGRRVERTVSTTSVFHTALDLAGLEVDTPAGKRAGEVERQSLARTLNGNGRGPGVVVSEAVPSDTVVKMMESFAPALMEPFHVESTVRAVYDMPHKLIHVEGAANHLYALDADPNEMEDLSPDAGARRIDGLLAELEGYLASARERRPANWAPDRVEEVDAAVLDRLRGLGYIQ
jgi:uncharacterized sulfatase